MNPKQLGTQVHRRSLMGNVLIVNKRWQAGDSDPEDEGSLGIFGDRGPAVCVVWAIA